MIDSDVGAYLLIVFAFTRIIHSGTDVSYTQKEFRYAKEKGIPILGFIVREDSEVEMADTEFEKIKRLEAFKKEVETGRIVDYWSNADNLATKVACALTNEIYGKPSGLELSRDYGEGIVLRGGWNFHNDIALHLEYKARGMYGDFDRPYDKTYDADGIESGVYFAEVMIGLLREKTKRTSNREDINQFIKDLAPYIQKTGYEIPNKTAQGLLNHFFELMNS